MRLSSLRRNALFWTAVALALFAIAMVTVVNVFAPSEAGHAYPHVAGGIPAVLLAVVTIRLWTPRRSRVAGAARAALVAGLLLFGSGQLLESIGALGWETVKWAPWKSYLVKHPALATLHSSIAVRVSIIAIPIFALGVVLTLLSVSTRLPVGHRRAEGTAP